MAAALSCAASQPISYANPVPRPGSARPADNDRVARAEAAFRRAGAAFDDGNLESALASYRESYALWARPRTLLNIGLVLRKLGRLAEAANLLAEYLEIQAGEVDPSRLAAVRKALDELDRELGRISIRAVGAEAISIDGRALDPGELARPIRVVAGRHRVQQGSEVVEISVTANAELTVELDGGRAVDARPVDAAVPAAAVVATLRTPQQERVEPRPRRTYLWAGAATVLLAGGTAVLAFRLRDQESRLDDILASPQTYDFVDAIAARDRARDTALFTNIGIGVTAAAAVSTVVLFVLRDGDSRPRGRSSPSVSFSVAPVATDGATLSLGGAW
jgi:tetratricopeptide (TPR) repeat protein